MRYKRNETPRMIFLSNHRLLAGWLWQTDHHPSVKLRLALGVERVHKTASLDKTVLRINDEEADSSARHLVGLRLDLQQTIVDCDREAVDLLIAGNVLLP